MSDTNNNDGSSSSSTFDKETTYITEGDMPQLKKLREMVQDEIDKSPSKDIEEVTSDLRLLRYLRCCMTIEDAANAYKKMLEARVTYKLDEVRETILKNNLDHSKAPYQDLLDEHAPLLCVWDMDPNIRTEAKGDIINIVRPANIKNPTTFLTEIITPEQLMENFRYHLEILTIKLHKESVERKSIVKMLRIQDMDGTSINMLPFMKSFVGPFMKTMTASYIGYMREVFLLNIPSFFSLMYAIVSPVMNEIMKKRVRPFSGDEYKQILTSEHCSAANGASSKSIGVIFHKLNEAKEALKTNSNDGNDFTLGQNKKVVVPAWSKIEMNVNMKKGNKISWEIQPDGNIQFYANKFCFTDSVVKVVKSLPNMTKSGDKDEFQAPTDGVISLILDNTASWMTQITVNYNIQLIEA